MRKSLVVLALIGWAVNATAQQAKPMLRIACAPEFESAGESAAKSQTGVLAIKIQNLSGINAQGLTVKYVVLKRDLGSKAVSIATQGEQVVDIGPAKTVTIKTEEVAFAQQMNRMKWYTTSSGGGTSVRDGDIVRSGAKYFGIGVAVYRGQDRLTTYYDNTSVEEKLKDLKVKW